MSQPHLLFLARLPRLLHPAPLLGLSLLLAGCASLDLGSTSHKRVKGSSGAMHERYLTPAEAKAANHFVNGDSITITLQNVFIKNYHEADATRKALGLAEKDKRGEIAIVAAVTPLTLGRTIEATPAGARSGRIVYYAESVGVQTQLPFSAIPLYGPVTYDGTPLQYALHFLELDQEDNTRTTAVIQNLASLGAKAYPPSSPVLKALESIGSGLLKNNDDDLILTYAGVFYPYGERVTQPQAYLTPGHLVLIRPDSSATDAAASVPWDALELDANAVLWLRVGSQKRRYTDATYAVLSIDKGQPPITLDQAETLAAFTERISKVGSDTTTIFQAGNELLSTIQKDENARAAKRLAADLIATHKEGKPLSAAKVERLHEYLAGDKDVAGRYVRETERDTLVELLSRELALPDLTAEGIKKKLLPLTSTPPAK